MSNRILVIILLIFAVVLGSYIVIDLFFSSRSVTLYIYYSGNVDADNLSIPSSTIEGRKVQRGAVLISQLSKSIEGAAIINYMINSKPVTVAVGYIGPHYSGELHIVIDEHGLVCILDKTTP